MVRFVWQSAVILAIYLLSAQFGLSLEMAEWKVTTLWPPAGIALALIWFDGWKWLPVIFLGEFLVALMLNQPVLSGVISAFAMMLEVSVARILIEQLHIRKDLVTLRDVFSFFGVVCLVAPVFGAAIGASGLVLTGELYIDLLPGSMLIWFVGDTAGMVLITPFIRFWWRRAVSSPEGLVGWMAATTLVGMLFAALFIWWPGVSSLFFFLLVPYVVYAAIRMGRQGVGLSLILMSLYIIHSDWQGTAGALLAAVQITFLGACAFCGYSICAMKDSSAQARTSLNREKQRLGHTLGALSSGVIKTTLSGKVILANERAGKLLGLASEDLLGCQFDEDFHFLDPEKSSQRCCPVQGLRQLPPNTERGMVVLYEGVGRAAAYIELHLTPVQVEGEEPVIVIGLRDITADLEFRRLLEYQASHDSITDLKNRRGLITSLEKRLSQVSHGEEAGPEKNLAAILYIDLERFKLVNDTCGHEIGNLMLKDISRFVRSRLVEIETLARVGGDEFVAVLGDENVERAHELAIKLRKEVKTYQFFHEELIFTLDIAVGISYLTNLDSTVNGALARADIACHQAKDQAGSKIALFQPEDPQLIRYQSELQWIARLRAALKEDAFELYYQGIFKVSREGRPESMPACEVLLRLPQDDHVILPGEFIPVAERFGLMPQIDRWVTRTLFSQIGGRQKKDCIFTLNLSGATFNDEDFFVEVEQWANAFRIERSLICFEITESVALENIQHTQMIVSRYSLLGYRFALDDFGAGSASYAYLSQLPVNYVKLDGSFVQGLASDPVAEVVVDSLVRIAHARNIGCIAECVEEQETANMLVEFGVPVLQGFLYSQPAKLGATEENSVLAKEPEGAASGLTESFMVTQVSDSGEPPEPEMNDLPHSTQESSPIQRH